MAGKVQSMWYTTCTDALSNALRELESGPCVMISTIDSASHLSKTTKKFSNTASEKAPKYLTFYEPTDHD